MSYVALPYLLKFLWAPFVDRFPLPFLGRRRGWILLTQLLLAVGDRALCLAESRPRRSARSGLRPRDRVFFGYPGHRLSMPIATDVSAGRARAGGGRHQSWLSHRCLARLRRRADGRRLFRLAPRVSDSGGGDDAVLYRHVARAGAGRSNSRRARYASRSSSRCGSCSPGPERRRCCSWCLLFKIGDAFAMKLFTPFMLDIGFTKTEIAVVVKALFTGGALLGAVLGGILMVRLGLLRSMLIFGVSQAVTNLLYCALAAAGKSYPLMVAAVVIEHVAGAMGNIALVALIMALCDVRYSAFQYALLSSIALLPRYGLGYPAGWVADHGGWCVTTLSALSWRCRAWPSCG